MSYRTYTRRSMVTALGATAATLALAGCADDEDIESEEGTGNGQDREENDQSGSYTPDR